MRSNKQPHDFNPSLKSGAPRCHRSNKGVHAVVKVYTKMVIAAPRATPERRKRCFMLDCTSSHLVTPIVLETYQGVALLPLVVSKRMFFLSLYVPYLVIMLTYGLPHLPPHPPSFIPKRGAHCLRLCSGTFHPQAFPQDPEGPEEPAAGCEKQRQKRGHCSRVVWSTVGRLKA